MTQRGGKLAKEGKTLAHKHFERSLLEIEALKPHVRLDPNEDRFNWDKHAQRYTNLVTQAMWLGYTIAQAEHRNYARGNFIIAHANDKTGKPVFTEAPYVHTQYKLARTEMKRLATRFRGRRFILYNSIQMEQCAPHAKERPLLEGDIDTGLIDDNGVKIFVSDMLRHYTGKVLVVCVRTDSTSTTIFGEDPSYDGSQVDLKDGRGYKIVRQCSYAEEEAALDEQFALTESAPDHGTFVLTIDKGRPEGDMSSDVRYNLDEDQPRFHPDHASD